MYERILVPLDRSPAAEVALSHAIAIARKFEASLLLVHVLCEAAGQSRDEGDRYLRSVRDRLEREKIPVETAIREGDPSGEILSQAGEHNSSLIVLASHGATAHQCVLDATVAHDVIQRSHVPVLLVKPPEFRTTRGLP
jgi:nucleotide-binding universal stress UspA family protein